MIAAVTGGTGFIGRHLVSTLIGRDVNVRLLTRRPEILRTLWPGGKVEPWKGEVTMPETLRGFVKDVQVIFHLAAEIRDPSLFFKVNETGTKNLLEVCYGYGIKKFLYLSSVGVMGVDSAGVVGESSACHPKNAYEKSKYAGEQIVFDAFKKHQVPVTVIRPTIVFGEGTDKDNASFTKWMQAIQNGWFRFIGSGTAIANYIYVADVVEACLLVAQNNETVGEIYVVEDSCSLYDFVAAAAEFLDVKMPGHLPTWMAYLLALGSELVGKATRFPVPLTRNRIKALTSGVVYSGNKLRETIGFRPRVGWYEGLRRTIEWYKRNELLPSARLS